MSLFWFCGGCQLQHIDQEDQLKYKLNAVLDALKRIGHLSLPPFQIVPASSNWAYRRHITLHLKPKENSFEAGYIGQDNHSLIIVETCPIFLESSHSVIKEIQQLVHLIPNPSNQEGRVTLLKNQHAQFILSFQFGPLFDIAPQIFQKALQEFPHLAGIIVQTPRKQLVLGETDCEQRLEGLVFRYSPQTFIQNNPEQSVNIYRQICELASHWTPSSYSRSLLWFWHDLSFIESTRSSRNRD